MFMVVFVNKRKAPMRFRSWEGLQRRDGTRGGRIRGCMVIMQIVPITPIVPVGAVTAVGAEDDVRVNWSRNGDNDIGDNLWFCVLAK